MLLYERQHMKKPAEFRKVFLALEPRDFELLDAIVQRVNSGAKLPRAIEDRAKRLRAAGLIFDN